MLFTKKANDLFAPVDSAGNLRQIQPHDAQVWGTEVERTLTAVITSGGKLYASKAAMDADTAPAINTPAIVLGDATAANNGLYRKSAAAGTAGWTRAGDVPGYSYITATNAGAGTANAIQATTSIPVPAADGGALIALPIVADNTASPVTVAFNGGTILTIKTNSGNDIAIGGLTAGMIVAGYMSGSTFRLLSDQASAAVLAGAEAARDLAEAWAEGTLPGGVGTKSAKEWAEQAGQSALGITPLSFTGDGATVDFTLPVDPGFATNVRLAVEGVAQKPGDAFTVAGTTLTFTEAPPDGSAIFGFIITATEIDIGVPSAGSVGSDELNAAEAAAMRGVLDIYSTGEIDTFVKGVKGADIASAATVDLGAATGDFVDVTGSTTITSLGSATAGVERTVRFTGTPIITHNAASLILFSGANITAYSGLVMRFRSLGAGNWIETSQTPAWGYWTPVLTFGSASTGITYGNNFSRWRRDGKLVKLWGDVALTSKGTATGDARIEGLPFTVLLSGVPSWAGSVAYATGMTGLTGALSAGRLTGQTISLVQSAASGFATITNAVFTNTSRITFEMSYEAA